MTKMNRIFNLYYLYTIFSSFILFLPVLLLIYINRGLSTSDMLIIEACYYFTIFLLEVPTGYIGDKFGHDKLVIVGLIGTTVAYAFFAFAFSLPMIILSPILLGIFGSCISGSDKSSLSFCIEQSGSEDSLEFHNKIYRFSTSGMLISFVFAGLILNIDSKGTLTFLITALMYLVATLVYILYTLNKRVLISTINSNDTNIKQNTALHDLSLKDIYFNKDVIICGILLGIFAASYVVSQIFYKNLEISSSLLGFLYCVSSITTIAFSKLKITFNRKMMFLMPFMFLITIINVRLTIVLFVAIVSLLKAKVKPFIHNFVLTYSTTNKAYNMSLMSTIYNLLNALFFFSLSRVILFLGFNTAMIIISILTCVLIFYLYLKSSEKYKQALEGNSFKASSNQTS